MTWNDVKAWVVQKSSVTNPNKKYWSASVTLGGQDVNGIGNTIERAYSALTTRIFTSDYFYSSLIHKNYKT